MYRSISILLGCFLLVISLMACESKEAANAHKQVVTIGYQKNGPLVILRGLGNLEERLEPLGYQVEWREFQTGPALTEALNANSIDIGRTGNAPVIFAQAAGAEMVVLAAGYSKYHGSGIIVHEGSEIQSLEDLKGKKVSFARGSSSHYLPVKALDKGGLSLEDIEPAYLSPGDARVAFEQGNIDAMVVWDPYTASTELHSNGVLLVNGEGLTTDRDFIVITDVFMKAHPDIGEILIEELEISLDWANNNHDELVEMLVPLLNLEENSIRRAVERRTYGVEVINTDMIVEQQDIADIFYELGIIPKEIDVTDIMQNE